MEIAFEDLCKRFDLFLERINANQDSDSQRGLLILDKTTYETTLQQLALKFRTLGTDWGVIQNIADTPLFVNSQASRVIQLADHVAYSVFRLYQASDTQYFNVIASRFDSEEGKIHGLVHKERDNPTCMCIACYSRRYTAQ